MYGQFNARCIPSGRNESGVFCGAPGTPTCTTPTTHFVSGKTPVPEAYIPPWDKHPDVAPSATCKYDPDTGLSGGLVPAIWGMVVMNVIWPTKAWPGYCCGCTLTDVDIDLDNLTHLSSQSATTAVTTSPQRRAVVYSTLLQHCSNAPCYTTLLLQRAVLC